MLTLRGKVNFTNIQPQKDHLFPVVDERRTPSSDMLIDRVDFHERLSMASLSMLPGV